MGLQPQVGPDGSVAKYKARVVAQGFSQVPGRDYLDTFAPVARLSSIRTILSVACLQDLEIHQMDVDTAYLNAPISEEIYMRQPAGFEERNAGGQPLVCRLRKSLYGLKQSARNWHGRLDAYLKSLGLTPTEPTRASTRAASHPAGRGPVGAGRHGRRMLRYRLVRAPHASGHVAASKA